MLDALADLHFGQPLWLVALLAPLLLRWVPRARAGAVDRARLARYADPHLLPYLLREAPGSEPAPRRFGRWTLLWIAGVLAMAGPRWDYTDIRVYRPGDALVVLFDISGSMRAEDVKPSRLARARQEVEDLLERSPGLRVGLIAFASVAHVVAPVTEDHDTIRHLMPSLTPDLLRWQGSRVSGALERAARLLGGQAPGSRHAVVLVTDGDFAEEGLEAQVAELRERAITVHVLGVGSAEGAPVPAASGRTLAGQDGRPVQSRLEGGRLEAIARAGGGIYREADYGDADTRALLRAVARGAGAEQVREAEYRVWDERYYLPVLVMAYLALAGFRRVRAVARAPTAGGAE